MEWISVKEKLPTEYKYYLVLSDSSCDMCKDKNLIDIDKGKHHTHKLNFRRYRYRVALWSRGDMKLAQFLSSLGDMSWDHVKYDRWTESSDINREITHWIDFPNSPE